LTDGAFQATDALDEPGVAMTEVGAPGVSGVETVLEGSLALEVPTALVAVTVKV
jgi:hypothetical protein